MNSNRSVWEVEARAALSEAKPEADLSPCPMYRVEQANDSGMDLASKTLRVTCLLKTALRASWALTGHATAWKPAPLCLSGLECMLDPPAGMSLICLSRPWPHPQSGFCVMQQPP